ncbi:hypothetical protein FW778_16995 [Ginsengibacter hankyongi]|uniref:Uncharacterized protein n=1 Tax=Ginsengibacter hankyongi TaxID=2607284 RepID=A0A5J5IET2_9BACT|nr:hypothetical protein [Ginsengibacter hankyongi]KAA9037127.1 hypothetical protein FW778_16995 [Ginsengibacter hankyongi]
MTDKYVTIDVSGVIIVIAERIDNSGMTKAILKVAIDPTEAAKFTKAQEEKWTSKNNKRMQAICKFMNENDL